jgi:hypothetical protein
MHLVFFYRNLLFVVLVSLVVLSVFLSSCFVSSIPEPMITITVTNNTTSKLKIICADEKKELNPRESKVFHGLKQRAYYVEVRSLSGITQFKKTYSAEEIGKMEYKITINLDSSNSSNSD